jgi:argininosuccinate synthase
MQGVGETDGLEAKAKASGASELFIADLREEFVKDYIFPCLRAGAVYERKYLLGTSMARPIIAKAMVDVAKAVGADAVSHGCTGKGNDQVIIAFEHKSLIQIQCWIHNVERIGHKLI